MNPCLLAFDTSTDRLAAALGTTRGDHGLNEAGGALASARLLPALRQLLCNGGVALAQLDAIAFGRGPGAFTGLRVACAVAQGLAFGAGKPVLAIDSLLILAEDARVRAAVGDGRWWVAVDARMDEVYAAEYAHRDGAWQAHSPPRLYTLPALAESWMAAPPQRVAGNAPAAFGSRLPAADAERWPECADRAAALLRLARAAWARGEAVDAAAALPLYLRDKVALTTAERAQRRATAAC